MSHELTFRQDGRVEMGYLAGTQRWHGLGNELAEGASIEDWITVSGMDWKVQRSRVRFATERAGDLQTWSDNHVLFRSDNKQPLAIVSDAFKIVQPREVLEFFRDLCATNGFTMRTAGTLFGGRRFWALADIGEQAFVLDPKDKVKGRLLLVSACDGTMKTIGKFVSECVVCNNTLTMARGENGKQVAVSHRSVFNPADAKAKLGLSTGQFAAFIASARMLAEKPFTLDTADHNTLHLLNDGAFITGPNYDKEVAEIRDTRGYKKIMALFAGAGIAANMPGRKDTAWGWLNAVTEYADHHIAARSDDNRFNSAQFGTGESLKNSALEIALAA